jgi:transketolase
LDLGTKNVEALSVDTIRALAMDAVQKTNSRHPGTPAFEDTHPAEGHF